MSGTIRTYRSYGGRKSRKQPNNTNNSSNWSCSRSVIAPIAAIILITLSIGIYYQYNYNNSSSNDPTALLLATLLGEQESAMSLGQLSAKEKTEHLIERLTSYMPDMDIFTTHINKYINGTNLLKESSYLPVLGPVPTDGAKPLWNMKHKGTDAIFALACNYPKNFYQRFVGSLRKSGYAADIVLAVSPVVKMKPGVEAYLKDMLVLSYAFDVDCIGKDNCRLKDDFLGYPDPRPHRTFANIRYALYEYWLRQYQDKSYILILDFRDTFFQKDPFLSLGSFDSRIPVYDLRLYAENAKVKTIGTCVYNALWIGRCFGKPALAALKQYPVLCSGSTLGSFPAINHYIRTMLSSMDSVKCWLKGIESDQGYQNYLYYNGYFNPPPDLLKKIGGNVTVYQQGDGIVNTIGAMNGKRVPKDKKGPLDTYWKARDKDGYILNNDGSRSACVHQWDRWYKDLHRFVDTKLF